MAEQKTDALSTDNSLIDPQTDRLGYAPFAKYLADSICNMTITQGFVIAVYGSWNSGKSTLMNFTVHYLQQKPEDERPIIVPFNPWLFSGSDDITKRFFEQIQDVLSKISSVSKSLRERIGDFAKAVGETSLPYAEAGRAVATLFDAQQKDASELKEKVEDTLTNQQQRIVVAVDDIDRLPAEDIKQLFRLLKAIPSFTNVVYLLFFNKKIVIKALTETQESPEKYLDKIVQASFELPFPDKTSLRRLLFEKLDGIITDTPERSIPPWHIYLLPFLLESRSYSLFKYIFFQAGVSSPKDLFDPVYWNKIYYQGIDHFITNLHDILRLTDTISLTYPIVKGEVNPVDFIAMESLRIFCPIVYDIIRKNKNAFTGDDDFSLDEIKSLQNSWMAELQDEDKQHIKKLLMLLFPKLEAIWGVNSYEKRQELEWCKKLRISCPEKFSIYFRLTFPESKLSNAHIEAILTSAFDAKAFGEKLTELATQIRPDGTTQVRAFLEQLENYTEQEIPVDSIPAIVQAFFDVGELLLHPEDEPTTMFDFSNETRISRIISQMLSRLDENTRFQVLKTAIAQGKALSIIVNQVETLAEQQISLPEEAWLISTQHFNELEEIVAKRQQEMELLPIN